MENKGHLEEKHSNESSVLEYSAAETFIVSAENQESIEMELCQQMTDTLSLTTLTHTLTPIPSLTDRTISISTNTNDLPRDYSYGTEDINENVKLTNWTTPSFATSTDDMIDSIIFDSDVGASMDEPVEPLAKEETVSTEEDDAYKWQDISTTDLWGEEEPTLVSYIEKSKKIVDSSSEDEPRKVRRMKAINMRMKEPSENSYPHSSNCSWSVEDFGDSSTIKSEVEDLNNSRNETSEYLVSNLTPITNFVPDDSQVATCSPLSSEVSVIDNIFDEPCDEFDENIEHNIIATRYGLPYDVVHCCCYAKAQMKRDREVGFKLCRSGSCHNFKEKFGELDDRAIRLWHTPKRLSGFEKACRIYNAFMNKPDLTKEKEFNKADYMLKVKYPHYWVHLNETYATSLTKDECNREHESKKQVTYSCQRVLKGQGFFSQHYQVNMKDFGETVKFSVDLLYLRKDFKLACSFLMKEYPSLFEHLMKNYGFEAFAEKRILIDENRIRFIEYSKQGRPLLDQLERRYHQESLEKIKKRNQV